MKKLLSVFILLSLFIPFLSACSLGGIYSEGSGELNIVCTNFPPFEFARIVGGKEVKVTILQDNGADLHNYTPTAATLRTLKNADVFICIGGESDEGWLEETLDSVNNENLKVIHLVDLVDLIVAGESKDYEADDDHEHHDHEDGEDDHDHEHSDEGDEHVWTSLKNAMIIVKSISEMLGEIDPDNAGYYSQNADEYIVKLDALDKKYEEAVENATFRTVVFADRFPFVYMMNDYEISYYAAFSGCSTEVVASVDTTAKLTNVVREQNLPAVIRLEGSTATLPTAIAAETDCKVSVMNSLQSITRGEIKNGLTYLGVMEKNLESLKEVLK